MMSHRSTQMELYMSTINPHIAKALRTNIHYGSRYATTSVGDMMKKAGECYLKDLYAQVGLKKDREQGLADKEVTCAEISMRNRNQWQSGGDRQRTWSPQENQRKRNNLEYSTTYDKRDGNDNTNNRTYRNTTGGSKDGEVKRIDMKQNKFDKNLQRSRPAAVARGGYTQIVVNPMQLWEVF